MQSVFLDIELNYSPQHLGKQTASIGVITPTDTLIATINGEGIRRSYRLPVERIHFGSVKINQSRDTSVMLVENTGNTSIEVGEPDIEKYGAMSFSIGYTGRKQTIYPHGKKKVELTFHPKFRGRISATLNFNVGKRVHTVQLYGVGAGPPEIHLEGKVLRQSDQQPLSAKVACFDLESNRLLQEVISGESGWYDFTMNPERKYRIVADKAGYLPSSIHLDLTKNFTSDSIKRNIYLTAIDTGATVVLNNIFFEYNKARLTNYSKAELDRMSRFLKENPEISIRLSGHTDSTGLERRNLILSRERAESVRNHLVHTGISPDRISARGYGENRPVADNGTEEGRRKNRRVEFTITGRAEK